MVSCVVRCAVVCCVWMVDVSPCDVARCGRSQVVAGDGAKAAGKSREHAIATT